ncbi:methyltransferase domain-containing protein [Paenibacillaceae bacterium]|nr:methyltransferase domain-containing protein [Paenibacillaceae bacterium]
MPPFSMRSRDSRPELMDDTRAGGAELHEAFCHLRRLNRIFGAAGPALYGIQSLWRSAGEPAKLSIMDVGSGSGEVNRAVLRWAEKRGISLTLTLVDRTKEACTEAERLYAGDERVQVRRGDVYDLPKESADIVTGMQFLHHFSEEELPAVVRKMLDASNIGVAIQDIHRHWLAWSAVWLTTRVVSGNRYIRHDGPLSVAKGFCSKDWRQLHQQLGIGKLVYKWRPLFRYAVIVPKIQESGLG